ncbi:MAG TPA: YpdA family putative bacillithiol disulfide reductase [Cytophagales bacterium]|nr:YpdA family putative bacillithiol disulfide reductase [Cytophagales bacterium]
MNVEDTLDVIIIGAGPIGMACGIEATKSGLSYLIIEKGCLVNSIYHYPLNMTFFSTSERLEIGEVPFICNNPKPNRTEALEYYRRVAISWQLKINLYEKVKAVEQYGNFYKLKTSKKEYLTRSIIIATGFYDIPNLLGIEGEELPKVLHYYREAHPFWGQKIAVIGAANSAVDVALETFRKGAEVTMVIRQASFGDNIKYWAKPDIENRVKEGSIKAYFNSSLLRIGEKDIDILTPKGLVTVPNDFVLSMTGYLPNFTLLEKMGISVGDDEMKTPVYNPETMETNMSGVYLAGVICGGLKTNKWFIENSRVHAEVIIRDILTKRGEATISS